MATVEVGDRELVVRLSPIEKVGALHGDVHVPRSAVLAVEPVERAIAHVRGFRCPGTGFPGVIGLGTWRQRHRVKDFVAVYRDRPGVVIELDRSVAPFRRLVLSLDSAAELQRQLGAGRGGGPTDVVG